MCSACCRLCRDLTAMRTALIVGLEALQLSPAEAQFLAKVRPAGIILFARNCGTHEQIRKLIADACAAIDSEACLVLIDQEGGRVQRLRPPLGRALPSAARYGAWYGVDREKACAGAHAVFQLLASDLKSLGINCNCAPVADLPVSGSHPIIGDRAYATTIEGVVALAGAAARGLMAGGVLPVIKHIPGHGRADADSHLSLPKVPATREELARSDFETFRQLNTLPAAMTAHVVFSNIDATAPASVSARVTSEIIRGHIGFDGLLMSDDLSMKALSGRMDDRARAVIAAGSDLVLHCNGNLAEMEAAASGTPVLEARAAERFAAACAIANRPPGLDFNVMAAESALKHLLEMDMDGIESV